MMECKETSNVRSDLMPRGLSLKELSKRFASPLTEEQAWAVCYQCCAMLQQMKWPWPTDMCMCNISMDGLIVTLGGKIELLRKQGKLLTVTIYNAQRSYLECTFFHNFLVCFMIIFEVFKPSSVILLEMYSFVSEHLVCLCCIIFLIQ